MTHESRLTRELRALLQTQRVAALGTLSPMFRPLWSLVHAAALALGLWLAITGRQPAWLERLGRSPSGSMPHARAGWQIVRGPGRAAVAGALWVAWPCGLLQSAVLVAALANSAWSGAAVMAVFALATGLGLTVAPWLWRRIGGPGQGAGVLSAGFAVRLAGALLAGASLWAMTHGLWAQVAAYCGF